MKLSLHKSVLNWHQLHRVISRGCLQYELQLQFVWCCQQWRLLCSCGFNSTAARQQSVSVPTACTIQTFVDKTDVGCHPPCIAAPDVINCCTVCERVSFYVLAGLGREISGTASTFRGDVTFLFNYILNTKRCRGFISNGLHILCLTSCIRIHLDNYSCSVKKFLRPLLNSKVHQRIHKSSSVVHILLTEKVIQNKAIRAVFMSTCLTLYEKRCVIVK